MATMRSGIYGVFDLAGGPVDPRHAATLGLIETPEAVAVRAIDQTDPAAVHVDSSDGMVTILLGHLDAHQELAARLSLAADTPTATLARAAWSRLGAVASQAMIGEWSFLHWDGRGTVTLMLSVARRDPLLFASCGNRLAVAPDLFRLRRLGWVADTIDSEGLLFGVGRTTA